MGFEAGKSKNNITQKEAESNVKERQIDIQIYDLKSQVAVSKGMFHESWVFFFFFFFLWLLFARLFAVFFPLKQGTSMEPFQITIVKKAQYVLNLIFGYISVTYSKHPD